jgi:hypothetical protein
MRSFRTSVSIFGATLERTPRTAVEGSKGSRRRMDRGACSSSPYGGTLGPRPSPLLAEGCGNLTREEPTGTAGIGHETALVHRADDV